MQVFFSSTAQAVDSTSYIAVLGTGGTIAGRASSGADHVGYTAGEVSVSELIGNLAGTVQTSAGTGVQVQCEQVAQIDSKDADWAFLWRVAGATTKALAQADCQAVVITHGTDTLEETAWFLACVLGQQVATKPVVLTCAMRPASALVPDGPQNLVDALTLAAYPGACGVQVCVAGASWSAHSVQKVHPYRLNAFDGADVGPVAYIEAGMVRPVTAQVASPHGYCYSAAQACLVNVAAGQPAPAQPWVELLVHTSAASEQLVGALRQAGVAGFVVLATGNGTLNAHWLQSLLACTQAGVPVWCATRCQAGQLVASALPSATCTTQEKARLTPATLLTHAGLPYVPGLSAVKARISLMLYLLTPRQQTRAG